MSNVDHALLPIDDTAWTTFLGGHPTALPFHLPEWATLLQRCYGYPVRCFAVLDGGAIVAAVPVAEVRRPFGGTRWVSLPFTDALPVLARGKDAEAALAQALAQAARESGVAQVELRDALEGAAASTVGVTHTLRLDRDPESVFARFKKTQVRQPIAQAERAGVTVRRANGPTDLTDTFYRLHLATRRRLGVPVQPRRYFSLLWEQFVERELGFVLVAEVDGRAIAAAVFLAWNGVVVYKYSASDSRFWSLRPNNLLVWTAIKTACEGGYSLFDFGRSDLANTGLRRFKAGWGSQEHALCYSALGAPMQPASGPQWLAKASERVIRRSPQIVCRLLGETLYRYAA